MLELILSLIPLAVAAAFQPPQVIALVIVLQTRRGIANALAFNAGMAAFRLLLGGAFWLIVSTVEEAIESAGNQFDILVGSVLVVLGLFMLVYALRRGVSAQGDDQAAASWLDKLESVSLLRSALVGAAFLALDPKDWIIDLSAVNLIADADLSALSSLLTYLIFVLMAQSLLWLPVVLVLVVPRWAHRRLAVLKNWMKRHERSIEVAVALAFGSLFLYLGLGRLGLF